MICDVVELFKYRYYKKQNGPFVLTFYEEDSMGENFELYACLKSLEKVYNDVPMVRFHYHKFIEKYPNEYVPSANHLMVIEKYKPNKYYVTHNKNEIPIILLNVRKKRLLHKKKNNKEYRYRLRCTMDPWIVNASKHRIPDIQKYLKMTPEMQYKFPNNTSFSFRNSLRYKSNESPEISEKVIKDDIKSIKHNESLMKTLNSKIHESFNRDLVEKIIESSKLIKLPMNLLSKHEPDKNFNIKQKKIIYKKILANQLTPIKIKNNQNQFYESRTESNKNKTFSKTDFKFSNIKKISFISHDLRYNHKITKEEFLKFLELRKIVSDKS